VRFIPGENSWKEILRIVKTRILGLKSAQLQGDDVFGSLASQQREQHHRITLDRLKIRKAIMFVGLMSCIAFSITSIFLVSNSDPSSSQKNTKLCLLWWIGLHVNTIRHMLTVFASFCALISVEYILINKINVCVLIFGDLPA
jgi:hypothetical protein